MNEGSWLKATTLGIKANKKHKRKEQEDEGVKFVLFFNSTTGFQGWFIQHRRQLSPGPFIASSTDGPFPSSIGTIWPSFFSSGPSPVSKSPQNLQIPRDLLDPSVRTFEQSHLALLNTPLLQWVYSRECSFQSS